MPQYYSGANPETAFASGMMAGYDFIDRIKARNEQVRLQKLQEARDSERFGMQKQEFALSQETGRYNLERARKTGEQQDTVFEHQQARLPVEEAQRDAAYSAQFEGQVLQNSAARTAIEEREDLKRGRNAYGDFVESLEPAPQPTLSTIGAQGLQQAPGSGVRLLPDQAAAPAVAPQAAEPFDLREAQRKKDAEPGWIDRATTAVKDFAARQVKRGEANFWADAADVSISGDAFVPGVGTDMRGVRYRDLRTQPERFIDRYAQERDSLDPDVRSRWDATMANAATERRTQLTAQIKQLGGDPRNQAKAASLQTELQQMNTALNAIGKSQSKSAAADAGITTARSAGDPEVVKAISKAGDAQRAQGVVPVMSMDQLRVTTTQLGRVSNPNRLTPKQMGLLSEAYRTGFITAETYDNWRRYGGPVAPSPPKIYPFGKGKGLAVFSNGQMAEIDMGDGKGGGEDGEGGGKFFKPAQAMEFLKGNVDSRIASGVLPGNKGTGLDHVGKMLMAVQRHAVEIQAKNPELDVLDNDGNPSMEWARDPYTAYKMLDWYTNFTTGLEDPTETAMPIENADLASQNIPETPVMQ